MNTIYYVAISFIGLWAFFNIFVAIAYSPREMIENFWEYQSWLGKFFANFFYFPAWVLNMVFVLLIFIAYWVFVAIKKVSIWALKVLKFCCEKKLKF